MRSSLLRPSLLAFVFAALLAASFVPACRSEDADGVQAKLSLLESSLLSVQAARDRCEASVKLLEKANEESKGAAAAELTTRDAERKAHDDAQTAREKAALDKAAKLEALVAQLKAQASASQAQASASQAQVGKNLAEATNAANAADFQLATLRKSKAAAVDKAAAAERAAAALRAQLANCTCLAFPPALLAGLTDLHAGWRNLSGLWAAELRSMLGPAAHDLSVLAAQGWTAARPRLESVGRGLESVTTQAATSFTAGLESARAATAPARAAAGRVATEIESRLKAALASHPATAAWATDGAARGVLLLLLLLPAAMLLSWGGGKPKAAPVSVAVSGGPRAKKVNRSR